MVPMLPATLALQTIAGSRKPRSSAGLGFQEAPIIVVDMRQHQDVPLRLSSSRDPGSHVIAVISDPGQRATAFLAGCDDYLLVPLVPDEVKTRIMAYLYKHQKSKRRPSSAEPTPVSARSVEPAKQAPQDQRPLVIGHLTSSIYHEVNNRMQAVDGSLSLALEEPDLSQDLRKYLEISKQEAERAIKMTDRLHRIYRPELDTAGTIDPGELLREVVLLVSDETTNRGVKLEARVPPDLPPIHGKYGQLQFAILGTILSLLRSPKVTGGSTLYLRAMTVGRTVQIELISDMATSGQVGTAAQSDETRDSGDAESVAAFSTMKETALSHHGDAGILMGDSGLSIWMSLPAS